MMISPELLPYESLMFILQKYVFHYDSVSIKELWKGREYQRTATIDLMYDICISASLNLDTVFIARRYLDFYFSEKKEVGKDDDVCLIGLSCLLLTSIRTDNPYIHPIDLLKFVNNRYTEDQLWDMLKIIKMVVGESVENTELFVILVCKEILTRWIKPEINIYVKKVHTLAYFFASMSLMSVELSHVNPKLIGIGAMIISLISYGFDRHASFLYRNCGASIQEMAAICDKMENVYKHIISLGDNLFINRLWKKNGFQIQ